MTKTSIRRLWLLALMLPVLFVAFQSSPPQAQAGPFDRAGMWIWYVDASHGGNPATIIRRAKASKIGTLYIKSADGTDAWSQFNPRLIRRFKRAGLNVCGWHYVYGRRPVAEARISALAKRRGADCFVIDAETEYEGEYGAADWYIRTLRRKVGPKFPVALSTFPYGFYHPAFPYSVFLGPGAAQVNLPQTYWHTIGDRVRDSIEITWRENALYKRPVYPIGQTYEDPGNREILAFRRYMLNYGTVPSWWSWQETNSREWTALRKKIRPVPRYRAIRHHPVLRTGSRGDQVVWLQQHLIAAGYRLQPTGIFAKSTRRAVRLFQKAKGLGVDGVVGTQTWNRILRITPVRVRWSKPRRNSAKAGASVAAPMSAPKSASLPAIRNELSPDQGS